MIDNFVASQPRAQLVKQWHSAGDLLQTLAASIVDNNVLMFGNRLISLIPKLLNGMKITSQLIHVTNDDRFFVTIKHLYKTDIRLTPHCQTYLEFIADIKHYRFDMIILEFNAEFSIDSLTTVFNMLNHSGILCLLSEQPLDPTIKIAAANQTILENGSVMLLTKARQKPQRRHAKES